MSDNVQKQLDAMGSSDVQKCRDAIALGHDDLAIAYAFASGAAFASREACEKRKRSNLRGKQ